MCATRLKNQKFIFMPIESVFVRLRANRDIISLFIIKLLVYISRGPVGADSLNVLMIHGHFYMWGVHRLLLTCRVAPNICESLVWNLLYITFLAQRIFKWLLVGFWKSLCNHALSHLFNVGQNESRIGWLRSSARYSASIPSPNWMDFNKICHWYLH